jgi:hypothetical protein
LCNLLPVVGIIVVAYVFHGLPARFYAGYNSEKGKRRDEVDASDEVVRTYEALASIIAPIILIAPGSAAVMAGPISCLRFATLLRAGRCTALTVFEERKGKLWKSFCEHMRMRLFPLRLKRCFLTRQSPAP